MKKLICLLNIIALLLFSCESNENSMQRTDNISHESVSVTSKEKPATSETSAPSTAEEKEESETNSNSSPEDVVSYLAKKDYLDFDSSSYLRDVAPEYVMLHFTSAVVLDKNNPYDMKKIRGIFDGGEIGINYIITREGEILCWLPEERAAWHAGKGELLSKPEYTNRMNYCSIGIEILAIGSYEDMSGYMNRAAYNSLDPSFIGYTEEQYKALSSLLDDICERYGIEKTREFIIGHEEYSKRKSDPGELFDWGKIGLKG